MWLFNHLLIIEKRHTSAVGGGCTWIDQVSQSDTEELILSEQGAKETFHF